MFGPLMTVLDLAEWRTPARSSHLSGPGLPRPPWACNTRVLSDLSLITHRTSARADARGPLLPNRLFSLGRLRSLCPDSFCALSPGGCWPARSGPALPHYSERVVPGRWCIPGKREGVYREGGRRGVLRRRSPGLCAESLLSSKGSPGLCAESLLLGLPGAQNCH